MQTTIKKIGGAVGVTIPAHLLKQVGLKAGDKVNVDVIDGYIVITKAKPKYTVDELLAKCNPNEPINEDMKEWDQTKPLGLEYGSVEWDNSLSSEERVSDDFLPEVENQTKTERDSSQD